MNKENARDYLPLVQALAEGKVIQIRCAFDKWEDQEDFYLNHSADQYRIKPEPREIWVNEYLNGVAAGNYPSRENAFDHRANDTAIQVRYREVLE